jgi:hypothetical protein
VACPIGVGHDASYFPGRGRSSSVPNATIVVLGVVLTGR